MKKLKHLFAVCLLLLVATTATAQSQSDNTRTKAVSATKADVNGDGVVNEADIEEIIAIMQQENGTKYYWYAGWTEPSADPEAVNYIGKIIDEEYPVSSSNTTTHKAGGTTNVITGYKPENPLYYYGDNRFNPGRKQYYLVLPNGIGVYGSDGANSLLDKYSLQESINIPNHKVYISNSGSSNIAGLMLY